MAETTLDTPAHRKRPFLSPLNQRRWRNFKRNRRAYWSLILFSVLFGLSLFAEFIANDKPILIQYRGGYYMPIFRFYPETAFGGDFQTEAIYRDPEVECLIRSGGLDACFDDPEDIMEQAKTGVVDGEPIVSGWTIWPPIPYPFNTSVERPGAARQSSPASGRGRAPAVHSPPPAGSPGTASAAAPWPAPGGRS